MVRFSALTKTKRGNEMTEHANTLKGIALYALRQWNHFESYSFEGSSGYTQGIRRGEMAANAKILKQITGRDVADDIQGVKEIIDAIPEEVTR